MCSPSKLRPSALSKISDPDVEFLELFEKLSIRDEGQLPRDLKSWLSDDESDVTVDLCRGRAMLSVSGGGLKEFEHDGEFKSYADSNHMFADLLVPLGSRVAVPIIFWLSRSNSPGVKISRTKRPAAYVVALGKPYSLADVSAHVSFILGEQKVRVANHWFQKVLLKHGLDPLDPAFANLTGLDE